MTKRPQLYVFFGLIASGKSTLADAWAKVIGANYYNSDRLRKELAGLAVNAPQQESFNAGIYTTEFSSKTYDALLNHASTDLSFNRSVILDGSYQAKSERVRLQNLATEHRATVIFVLCRCPEELMKERMAQRAKDPEAVSDGRWEIYLQQKARFEAPDELSSNEIVTIDTNAPVEALLIQLGEMIEKINADTYD
jgi:predicted kinase